jgi:hypothetical protein
MTARSIADHLPKDWSSGRGARPVIGSWQALIDYCSVSAGFPEVEEFRLLFLDRKNALIHDEPQQRGTVDHTPVYPREVVKLALELGASAIIMVHVNPRVRWAKNPVLNQRLGLVRYRLVVPCWPLCRPFGESNRLLCAVVGRALPSYASCTQRDGDLRFAPQLPRRRVPGPN